MQKSVESFKQLFFNKLALPMGSVFTLLVTVIALQFYFNAESIANSKLHELDSSVQNLSEFISAQILVNNETAVDQKVAEFNKLQTFAVASWNPGVNESQATQWSFPLALRRVIPVQVESKSFGSIFLKIDLLSQKKIKFLLEFSVSIILLSVLLLSYLFWYATRKFPEHYLIQPLNDLVEILEDKNLENKTKASQKIEEFEGAKERVTQLLKELKDSAQSESLVKVASQISHDIRSPLSALEMMLSVLNELPEEKRLIIRNSVNRIKDIANELLKKYKEQLPVPTFGHFTTETPTASASSHLILPLLEEIISEKRIQYRNVLGTEIWFNQSKNSYGHFSNINPVEFKRVMSNLINNAIEAFPKNVGTVKINLQAQNSEKILISVEDNGSGISSDLLNKIGFRGATFNKSNGTGLGLFGAKEITHKWGGELTIESQLGKGTKVSITIPKSGHPEWFVPKLSVSQNACVIAFDDDQTIHQIWKGRFESLSTKDKNILIRNFTDPSQLRQYYGENFTDLDQALFLVDYEIIGSDETGLDLIEQLGIQSQSVLVTSRYEEDAIRNRCARQGIKIIPKSMSGFVPIEIT